MRDYTAGGGDLARTYAQIVGVILILTGLLGIVLGDPADGLLGLLNIDIVEDIIHILSGAILAYVGFVADRGLARMVVGGLGVVYVLVGILGFVDPELFGLIPNGYNLFDNLFHLALGALALAVAFLIGGAGRTTTITR